MLVNQFPIPIPETEKAAIVQKLREKGVSGSCPMCHNANMVLADGYITHPLQPGPNLGFMLGGPAIPTVAIVCTNCGFMSHHALGALGLLPGERAGQQ